MLQSESDQLGGVNQWMHREMYRCQAMTVEHRAAMEKALKALEIGEPGLAYEILVDSLRNNHVHQR